MKLSKAYQPSEHERQIYDLWLKADSFKPVKSQKGDHFSIVMPPPNANGNLHIGYELTGVLEDIAVRYQRMKGKSSLLLPGADHAGFETQVVYEKVLAKEGKSRFDFSRDDLYKQIWDFVAQNRQNFETQMRKMGISCDWSRFTFTLDDKIVATAYKTFQKMWNDGLIYRGVRLVNFCTFHGTAFADIEVEHKEELGHLWHIRYPLTDGSGELAVATTRPETMLGDTAVAVNPSDKRYTEFVGKTIKLPLTKREIPIIADDFVDVKFGTGAVKITPAHDPNDYEAAQRHDLPMMTVIDYEGKMNQTAGEDYRGLTVKEARQKVVDNLKEQGFLVKTEAIKHNVGHCYKCGTVIEPLLKDQWFIDMQPLAKAAIKALQDNKIKFYPASKKTQLIKYLEGLRDWNISRQIAWGIPIPAFQNVDDPDDWIYDERVDSEEVKIDGKTYRRDPDVFDTWFSSSSWPYATLDFPDGQDLKDFYPLSLMETGGEILYPWVSRMIMLGLYVAGDVPFEAVYIHGYVMAEDGSKMSKSVGNVVDPMPVIDQYGSDALRMGIISGRAPAVNRGYDPRKVEDGRNFANKLWNVARYIDDITDGKELSKPEPKTVADHWVLLKLQQLTDGVSKDLESFKFSEAFDNVYHGIWDDFADWYIEASKVEPNPSVLKFGLETILKLAHPFAPFVTEAIYQQVFGGQGLLITAPWPEVPAGDKQAAKDFEEVKSIVSEIRNLVTELKLAKPRVDFGESKLVEANVALIERLSRAGEVRSSDEGKGYRLTQTKQPVWLDIDEAKLQAYAKELQSREEGITAQIKNLEGRLANKGYVQSAPEAIVNQTKHQLEEAHQQATKLRDEIARFS